VWLIISNITCKAKPSINLKKTIFFVLFVLSFGCGIMIENTSLGRQFSFKDANELLRKKLEKREEVQMHFLSHPDLLKMIDGFDVKSELYKELTANHMSLFAYKNKCLTFWSDNFIQQYNFKTTNLPSKKILYNRNGWYQMVSMKKGDYDIYCYYWFYQQYPFNNEYFVDRFNEDLNIRHIDIIPHTEDVRKDISGYEINKELPRLKQSSYNQYKMKRRIELVYIISACFFVIFAFLYAISEKPYTGWGRMASMLNANAEKGFNVRQFVILLSSFSAIFCYLAFSDIILKHKLTTTLFSPVLAAYSPFIPSLGHSLFFSFAVLSFMVLLQQAFSALKPRPGQHTVTAVIISILSWALPASLFIFSLPKFILNSQINYDFKSLTNVGNYTLIGMFNVFLMFIAIVIGFRIFATFSRDRFRQKNFFLIHLVTGAIILATIHLFHGDNAFLLLCFAIYGLLLPFLLLFTQKIRFTDILISASITAAFLSVQFEQLNSFKEKEQRKVFANKLITKEDFESELKLLDIEKELIEAAVFDSFYYYNLNDYQELELNYKFTFFNDFIKNYDIDFMRYDSSGADITPNNLSFDYINSLYNKSTNKSITNYFLYIKDLHYLGGYLAKYEICPEDRNIGYVFLMLTPKVKSDLYNLDYFFSKISYNHLRENQYSYAVYKKNELIKGLGTYPFKLYDNIRYQSLEDASFFEQNGFSQLFTKIDHDTFIIVSLKAASWDRIFGVFTFILIFFTIILALVFSLIYFVIFILGLLTFHPFMLKLYGTLTRYLRIVNLNKLYLETKIRLSFLLLAILICSVVIYFTVQNVNRSFKIKQYEVLDKKMSQIANEIEIGYQKKDERPIRNLIKHLANTYEVDINLYLKDGTLYQTANNRIYYEGWFSALINPVAHYELIQNKQYSIKQFEKIGNLEYLSYYNTVFDENRNLVGYVHLPYFSKSLDLKNEFSNYLGSLINISTLLLMISLLVASYIGRSLVRPLKLMIESLARIRLGAQNKQIDWNRNDEIGQLVEQYNVMLKKLEISTEKLAQSEREGAWKEMAKQVAHEIKNPLTPMKLHLQHLQMSINRDDVNLKEKITKISQILIEQIDQLSRMADEFSSFAKMPVAVLENANLNEVLNSCIDLFKSQHDLHITYTARHPEVEVNIDKDQMKRVFTNILKNASQAARENETCTIEVDTVLDQEYITISFKDNGKGIEEDVRERIFTPNFSTKNSGMGLGLAMSKKIVEHVNGTITFTSETNKGTTFYVTLPVVKTL
jgi:two-component system nitrogen regulation sensor histidine kinase NtrY